MEKKKGLYIYLYIYIEIRNKQVTPAIENLGYLKRPPVKWKPLNSPNFSGKFRKNLRIMETSSHLPNHHRVTALYGIPYSKVLNGEKELEKRIKNALTQTWSHLVDLSNGVKKLGGGVQIAGGEDEEDGKERQIEKRRRGGEKLVNQRPKRGRNPPVACGA